MEDDKLQLEKPKKKRNKLQEFLETLDEEDRGGVTDAEDSEAISLHPPSDAYTSASEISLSEADITDVEPESSQEIKALSDTEINTERNKCIPLERKVQFATKSHSFELPQTSEPAALPNRIEEPNSVQFGTRTDELYLSENEREEKLHPQNIPTFTPVHAHTFTAPYVYHPVPTTRKSKKNSRKRHRNPHKKYKKLRDYQPSLLFTTDKFAGPSIFGDIDIQQVLKDIGHIEERDVFKSFANEDPDLDAFSYGYESDVSTSSFDDLLKKIHILKVKKENQKMLRNFEVNNSKKKRISFGTTEEVTITPFPKERRKKVVKNTEKPKQIKKVETATEQKPKKQKKIVVKPKVEPIVQKEEDIEEEDGEEEEKIEKVKSKKQKKKKGKNKKKKKKKAKKKKKKKKSLSSEKIDVSIEEPTDSGFIDVDELVKKEKKKQKKKKQRSVSSSSSQSSEAIIMGKATHVDNVDAKQVSTMRIEKRLQELKQLAEEEEALEAQEEGEIGGGEDTGESPENSEEMDEEEGPEPMIGIQYDPERQICLGDPIKLGTTCYAVDFLNGKKFRKCKVIDFKEPATYTVKFGMFRKQPGTQRLDIVLKQPKSKGGKGFGLKWLFTSTKDVFKAAEKGDCQAVLDNILKNPDVVEKKGGKEKQTPLYYAAKEGHEDVVKLLLRYGAEDDEEGTILSVADESVQTILTDFGYGRVGPHNN